ncbi:hypothetical protein NDU88_007623 [Pleurodeles waltl]|uniref:Uncharacterized protein n=1 Tax=Pleurodeles waltl TaxID=8319 RepID=A0AAV7U0M4_PLEWA|nr:hypothetical protein NDU88_007623 [Pleurodeles waltl]
MGGHNEAPSVRVMDYKKGPSAPDAPEVGKLQANKSCWLVIRVVYRELKPPRYKVASRAFHLNCNLSEGNGNNAQG